jgi:hypothetical protein
MLEPSRRHGHYDERWATVPVPATSRAHPIDSEPESTGLEPIPDGLSWEAFGKTFYSGKRHYFPAIEAWSLYRDGNRSRPRAARNQGSAS